MPLSIEMRTDQDLRNLALAKQLCRVRKQIEAADAALTDMQAGGYQPTLDCRIARQDLDLQREYLSQRIHDVRGAGDLV